VRRETINMKRSSKQKITEAKEFHVDYWSELMKTMDY
jgi:hypothetical protein